MMCVAVLGSLTGCGRNTATDNTTGTNTTTGTTTDNTGTVNDTTETNTVDETNQGGVVEDIGTDIQNGIDNVEDVKLLINNQEQFALGIAKGICKYLNIEYKPIKNKII